MDQRLLIPAKASVALPDTGWSTHPALANNQERQGEAPTLPPAGAARIPPAVADPTPGTTTVVVPAEVPARLPLLIALLPLVAAGQLPLVPVRRATTG